MLQRKTKVSFQPAYGKKVNDNSNLETAIRKHDRYLIELEKQKQLVKNLQRKNSSEEAKEKRERGFSSYVNGANAPPKPKTPSKLNLPKSKQCFPNPKLTHTNPRNKQANSYHLNSKRRFWGQESVEIATDSGAKLYASLRTLNCKYSDDFETDSIDFEKSGEDMHQEIADTELRPKSVPLLPHRKYWGQGSVMIKASSGEDLRASISNVTDYSMNFEADSDATVTDSEEEIAEEIEPDLSSSNEFKDSLTLDQKSCLKLEPNFSNRNKT